MCNIPRLAVLAVCLLAICGAGSAYAQCILSNPSFEVGSPTPGGWNQFGSVGMNSNATHGSNGVHVSGYSSVDWAVSGYWQRFDTAPGEQWEASIMVSHSSAKPLTGGSKAIVNIEWRDAGDNIISYESHDAATSATPTDDWSQFGVTSGPAPSGAVATHILFAILQEPGQPLSDVFYDSATFYSAGPPSQDDIQWNDFPGGRTISFAGYTWRVKGPGWYGPGPNLFNDAANSVWVDVDGRLHMTIKNLGGNWYSTEVVPEDALGYGDYIFTTVGRIDNLDVNAVLGMFLWEYGPCWHNSYLWWNPYNEIDIEFSRWGNPNDNPAQFVAQPYDWPGNINRFDVTIADGELTSHAFRWLHDRVEFRSWRGGPGDESPGNMIHEWIYTGPHISRPEQPRVHINLWSVDGNPPAGDQEVVFDEFTFVSETVSAAPNRPVATTTVSHLDVAVPNPFNPSTTIGYRLPVEGQAEIVVYDVLGRLVRTLVSGYTQAGDHEVVWDGRDDSGRQVASGVYLYRLQAGDIVETRRMVLLK